MYTIIPTANTTQRYLNADIWAESRNRKDEIPRIAKAEDVSRVWFSASRDKIIFPKSFSEVHKKYKSPYKAIRGYMLFKWFCGHFYTSGILGTNRSNPNSIKMITFINKGQR